MKENWCGAGRNSKARREELRTERAACEYRPEEVPGTSRLCAKGALLDTVPNDVFHGSAPTPSQSYIRARYWG